MYRCCCSGLGLDSTLTSWCCWRVEEHLMPNTVSLSGMDTHGKVSTTQQMLPRALQTPYSTEHNFV